MHRSFRALFAAALIFPALAVAQETKPLNLSIRIGQFKPSNGFARSEGDTWSAFGLETRFKNLGVSASNPSQSSYLTWSFDTFGSGDFRATPILLNYVSRTNELYFTGGAGVAFTDEPDEGSGTRVGLQVGVGWDWVRGSTPLFVEAKYFFTTSNDRLNGFGIFLGARL